MIIEKSPNHKKFSCKDRKIYETLTTGECNLIKELDFYYPNNDNLPQGGIDYLNKHYEFYNNKPTEKQPTPAPVQFDLFG